MATDPDPRLPPKWTEMLAQVEQTLNAALEAADRREQALPPPTAALDLTEGFARFRERLRGLAECAAREDQAVASADADLAAGEEALRSWFQAAEAVRRKLADWAGRA
jgi:hypothetical protein